MSAGDAEMGGGSLATLVIGGAISGDRDGGDGACADCGAGADVERVGAWTGAGTEEEAGAVVETAPVSSETRLRETALPEKNSPAVSEGSIEGAGGKMSDWNESDYGR